MQGCNWKYLVNDRMILLMAKETGKFSSARRVAILHYLNNLYIIGSEIAARILSTVSGPHIKEALSPTSESYPTA